MSEKFRIKSLKELREDWQENWAQFTKGFNDFFGIPNKEIIVTEHLTKETAIDITPEDTKDEIGKKQESYKNSALIERTSENNNLTPAAWEKKYQAFSDNTMSSFHVILTIE